MTDHLDALDDASAVAFTHDDRPRGIDDVELAVFEGEAVLFDVQASMVHLFNAVAGATWLCCDGDTTVAAMVAELADTFSVTEPADRSSLETAVHDSLVRFAEEGLLADVPRPARLTLTPDPVLAHDGTEIVVAPPDP